MHSCFNKRNHHNMYVAMSAPIFSRASSPTPTLINKHIVSFLCISPVFCANTNKHKYICIFFPFPLFFEKEFKRARSGLVCASGGNTQVERS